MDTPILWQPHDGPQANFLTSSAYEALYGGAAGGGKTDALIWDLAGETEHPDFKGLLLRRTFPELREVMDRMHAWFPKLGAEWVTTEKRWRFPSGATIQVGYGATFEEVQQYGGHEYTTISYDELGNVAEERVWTFLMSRNRTTARGLLLRMRASANPGQAGHAWIKRRFITICPRDGEPVPFVDAETGLILTRAFFAARVEDNPAIMRDRTYIAKLNKLPEAQRKQLREGDWSAGAGMALADLAEAVHLVPPYRVPPHWRQFGAFDWGYQHPFAFGRFAANEDGGIVLLNSVHGRHRQPDEIATRIVDSLRGDLWNPTAFPRFAYIVAGHDCWADHKARGEDTPTIAEQMGAQGLHLTPASISRVAGLNNMRGYLQWKFPVAGQPDRYDVRPPRFVMFDTPSNRVTYECWAGMTTDPHDPEDALKRDADDDGIGGDDPYDMGRYALASRPLRATTPLKPVQGAWDPEVLQREADWQRRVRTLPAPEQQIRQLESGAGW